MIGALCEGSWNKQGEIKRKWNHVSASWSICTGSLKELFIFGWANSKTREY